MLKHLWFSSPTWVLALVTIICPTYAGTFEWINPIPLPNGSYNPYTSTISPDGSAVAGSAIRLPGSDDTAYRWTQSTGTVSLGNLGGDFPYSKAAAGSLGGSVIVGRASLHPQTPYWLAFRWSSTDGMASIGDLAGGRDQSEALGLSRDGSVIVGSSSSKASGSSSSWTEAFRWTEQNGMQGLGGLTVHSSGLIHSSANGISLDGNVIVGQSWSSQGYEAFRWSEGQMIGLGDLPGGEYLSFANDASLDGSVIVGGSDSVLSFPTDPAYEAFRWTAQTGMVGLGDLSGGRFHSVAVAVSGDGNKIVGYSDAGGTSDSAFFWDTSTGMRSMESFLTMEVGLDLAGCHLYNASGISEDGMIITGTGACPGAPQAAVWVAVVPEPGGACGLFLICILTLHRRSQSARTNR
jgi:probable HAF family extracellular repeat protein